MTEAAFRGRKRSGVTNENGADERFRAGGVRFSALSEPIKLISEVGCLDIEGELIEFDGHIYRVETLMGRVSVPLTGTLCAGALCPDGVPMVAVSAKPVLSLAVAPPLSMDLVTDLIVSFAQSERVSADLAPGTNDTIAISLGGTDLPDLIIGSLVSRWRSTSADRDNCHRSAQRNRGIDRRNRVPTYRVGQCGCHRHLAD
ncbi:hypothetical protein [Actibacterium sp. 188UL27-1]|uniref:hypothetical protein n=1 Tax=Actibacterium sp. 188UL27-1 TaxID=2786961 RepID=UPI00195BDDE6|nr:hypothetical protein [Actibacterium sp. 188UL27-1]MBM7067053.1 hypothetical protein [Actibacterium sp. 188UL27-1]